MAITVTRQSILDGQFYSMDLEVTEEQLVKYDNRELLLQNAFPNLKREEREFIKSGITPEEWDRVFNTEEDDAFDDEHSYE